MTQFAFGTGTLIMRRTDLTNIQPALLGVLQDVSIDFDHKIEELVGQSAVAVALAGAQLSIKGKAKFARLQATQLNNLFFGQTQSANAGIALATAETGTVSGGAVTVANGATFVADLGVFTAAGVQLQPVASAPATGVSYIPGAAGVGTYTFNAGDNATPYLFYYRYTTASGQKIALANPLMGPMPTFELNFQEQFTYFGAQKNLVLVLNACAAGKLSLGFNNTKWMIPDFEFVAQADANNNWGTIALTE
jgi:hypothetical protein